MKIWTDDEEINLEPNLFGYYEVEDIEKALLFKSEHIKAKADKEFFELCASMIHKLKESFDKLAEDHNRLFNKEYKYRWHDLRKNPDDLPEESERVEICIGVSSQKYYTFGCYENIHHRSGWWSDSLVLLNEVIAWRYIEPFEGK